MRRVKDLYYPSVRGLQYRLSPLRAVLDERVFYRGGVVL